jgi:hypothetical protein
MKNNYFLKNITTSTNKFQNISNIEFANVFSRALETQGVIVSYIYSSEEKNLKHLTIGLLFGLRFVRKTRKLFSINFKKNTTYLKKNAKFYDKINKIFGTTVSIKLINLNKLVTHYELLRVNKKICYYQARLFVKREYFFYDFQYACALLVKKKINVWAFLSFLSIIFKVLEKKKHGMFIYFIKNVFSALLLVRYTSIVGMKFRIAGRLKGKQRGSNVKVSVGRMSLTEETTKIENAQCHVHTRYGCYGIKLWVNFKI